MKLNLNFLLFGVCFLASLATTPCLAQEIQTERVRFSPGASSATIEGAISGDQVQDYLLNVSEGQLMNISMASPRGGIYFNIMEPGEEYAAIHIGSTVGNQFEGTAQESGDYRIRLYLMGDAQSTTVDYRLEMIVTGAANPNPGDAQVAGTNYHATGEISCKLGYGQPTSSCPFGVVRKGNGTADVTVTVGDGSTRTISFELGQATSYEAQQDLGDLKASREGYLYIVEIGEERYEIPDAVISGG